MLPSHVSLTGAQTHDPVRTPLLVLAGLGALFAAPTAYLLLQTCIHEGRSSNLWYGSFFPDAPHLFLSAGDLATIWAGPRRIFMWQSLTDPPNQLPSLPGPVYVLVRSGGKEIVSNQPIR